MWTALLEAIFPAQCAHCNALGSGLCAVCRPHTDPVRQRVDGLDVIACGWYEGALRSAVLALKDGRRDVAAALGERIAATLGECIVATGEARAVLVPVPTTQVRVRVRGVDGVAVMAKIASQRAGATWVAALSVRAGRAQQGRTRDQRLTAVRQVVCDPVAIGERSVLLIDDVCTTGATLHACARAIEAAGGRVAGAAVAALTKAQPRGSSVHGARVRTRGSWHR